ncbi:hypothetical protein [Parahaliea aestuarii]|uniref:hypothetical protein n=1 Tax=Parahaliea aestuarii TaxID=1852021 RepID=UPI001650AD0D|nr:hypothetical protein [Parahaliea aestuarii]
MKVSVAIAGLLLLSVVSVIFYALYVEGKSKNFQDVVCQVNGIADIYNQKYIETGSFSINAEDRDFIRKLSSLYSRCGVRRGDASIIRDPWGDEISIESISDNEITIYSVNQKAAQLYLRKDEISPAPFKKRN